VKIKVRNSRTGEYDYEFTSPTPAALQTSVQQLRQAQPPWAAQALAYRSDVLQRWQAALDSHRAAILAALTADTGCHLLSVVEIDSVLRSLERWCQLAPLLRFFCKKALLFQTGAPLPLSAMDEANARANRQDEQDC
jgi:succinate-semialdehyde dehydrogenase / glutarate-semialdehyde dehydrogenase